jgi:peroxiredoxin
MSKGLHPGANFPDFELPDEEGVLHRLSDLQGSNPMVVQLGRGEHCPRERQHHRELLRFHEWCATALTELVTILPNDLHDVKKLKMTTGAHWTFLSDRDLEVQQTFDIDEYVDRHHAAATVPHTVLLAPGLVIDKVYVGFWFWGRPSVYDLWADLRDLRSRINVDFDPTLPDVRAAWFDRHPDVAERPPRPEATQPKRRRTARTPARA